MAIASVQNWTNGNAAATSVALAYGVQPKQGDLGVCFVDDKTGTITSVTDDTGDSVNWSQIVAPLTFNVTNQIGGWYKVFGAPVGNGKTVTASGNVATVQIEVYIAEYSGVASVTQLDGTPTSNSNVASTNPDPGAITVSGNASLVIGFVDRATGQPTANGSYTNQSTSNGIFSSAVEDRFPVTAGSHDPNWTAASDAWAAIGVAFAANPSITAQPTQQKVTEGSTATFTITATAGNGTLHYQWKSNGSNVGTDSNSYTTAATVAADDQKSITCVVTDTTGSVTSIAVYLLVNPVTKIAWITA